MNTHPRDTIRRSCQGRPVSEVVVETVSSLTDSDPTKIDPPLYNVIDPDALDVIFRDKEDGSTRPGRITFTLGECEIVVIGDDVIVSRKNNG